MPIESLVGEELIIDVSDPWELTAPPGLPGRSARVVGERAGGATLTGDALLLELVAPIPYRGAVYHAAVAKPRQSESLVSCLLAGGSCEASVYGIPAADP